MEAEGFVEDGGEVGNLADSVHGWRFVLVWECNDERFFKFRERDWVGEEFVSQSAEGHG